MELDLRPDPAVIEQLHELVARLGLSRASRLPPRTESERHLVERGHPLRHGCCAVGARQGAVRPPQ